MSRRCKPVLQVSTALLLSACAVLVATVLARVELQLMIHHDDVPNRRASRREAEYAVAAVPFD